MKNEETVHTEVKHKMNKPNWRRITATLCAASIVIGSATAFAPPTSKAPQANTVNAQAATSLTLNPSTTSEKTQTTEVAPVQLHSKAKLTKAAKPRYITTKAIKPRSGIGKGSYLGSATAGYKVTGTGKVKSGHTQIYFFNRIGWVKSNQLKRVAVNYYTTKKATTLYSSPGSGKKLATVLNDYTVGTMDNVKTKNGAWIKVQHKGKTGWIASKHVKKASANLFEGPGKKSYSDAAYAKQVKSNMAKYCKNVRVDITNKKNTYYATSYPEKIVMSRESYHDPASAPIKSISLHECAHIKTYRLYSDFSKFEKAAEKINPQKDGMGSEHLADCMSDIMGGKRSGVLPNGWTYTTGYGGKCTAKQKAASKKLLQGKKI